MTQITEESSLILPIQYNKASTKQRKAAREQYTKIQNDLCWYCKQSLLKNPVGEITKLPINKSLFPTGFFRWPIHLHHCHRTGLTIGSVHSLCNAILWQYEGR